jgi:uroporphyrinogen-III synthase
MTERILITRPLNQAKETEDAFKKLGLQPILSPVLKVVKIPFTSLPTQIGAVVISSQNALYACEGIPKNIPFFCVGAKTAEFLRREGFENICLSPDGTLKGLLPLILKVFSSRGGLLLYVRGQHVSEDIKPFLKKNAPSILIAERIVYVAQAVESLTLEVATFLKQGMLDFVTFFSRRSARQFVILLENERLIETLDQVCAVCLSSPVQDIIQDKAWKHILVAPEPTLFGMVQVLEEYRVVRRGTISDSQDKQREESA